MFWILLKAQGRLIQTQGSLRCMAEAIKEQKVQRPICQLEENKQNSIVLNQKREDVSFCWRKMQRKGHWEMLAESYQVGNSLNDENVRKKTEEFPRILRRRIYLLGYYHFVLCFESCPFEIARRMYWCIQNRKFCNRFALSIKVQLLCFILCFLIPAETRP